MKRRVGGPPLNTFEYFASVMFLVSAQSLYVSKFARTVCILLDGRTDHDKSLPIRVRRVNLADPLGIFVSPHSGDFTHFPSRNLPASVLVRFRAGLIPDG